MKPNAKMVLAVGLMVALTACVAGSAESHHAAAGGAVSHFFLGLWHGMIAPVTLIIEIVDRFLPHRLPWSAHLYETSAAGALYDLGFYIGLSGGPLVVWSRF